MPHPTEMEYLSYSRLSLYDENCPRAFYKQYVEVAEVENPTTDWYAEYGTLVHQLSEDYERSHGFLPESAMSSRFNEEFSKIAIPDHKRDEYWEQGQNYIARLAQSDTSNIIGIEWEFSLKLFDDMPPIRGFVDKLTVENGEYVVYDFKSSRPYTKKKVATSLQFAVYGLAVFQEFGVYPSRYRYEYVRFNEYAETTRTLEQMEDAKRRIYEIWSHMRNEEYDPKVNAFFCREFCGFRLSCPAFAEYQSRYRKG